MVSLTKLGTDNFLVTKCTDKLMLTDDAGQNGFWIDTDNVDELIELLKNAKQVLKG